MITDFKIMFIRRKVAIHQTRPYEPYIDYIKRLKFYIYDKEISHKISPEDISYVSDKYKD